MNDRQALAAIDIQELVQWLDSNSQKLISLGLEQGLGEPEVLERTAIRKLHHRGRVWNILTAAGISDSKRLNAFIDSSTTEILHGIAEEVRARGENLYAVPEDVLAIIVLNELHLDAEKIIPEHLRWKPEVFESVRVMSGRL